MYVIITGVTGMVGEGVLHECLLSPEVEKVLVVNRRPCGTAHPKLSEVIVADFFNLDAIQDRLRGFGACFFCLGITSVGTKKEDYEKITYDLTMGFAKSLVKWNAGMTFCYVSGRGTDSSEKSRLHWARVKGKTENDLQKLGFRQVFLFRPAMLKATEGSKNTPAIYKWLRWLVPILETFFPGSISSLAQLGQAMIQVSKNGYDKNILEVSDIKRAAAKTL
jgi:uncharacterized protein YbjT (DUF2867 family)